MSEFSSPGKHSESIIPNSKTKRVRRPGIRRQVRIIIYVLIIVAAAVVAGYFLLRPKDESYTLRDYTTAVVEVRTIQDDLQLGGTVRARTEATIRAPASGILDSVLVDVGGWVKPGQVVAVLNAAELRSEYEARKHMLKQSLRTHESLLLSREQAILVSSRSLEDLEALLEDAKESLAVAQELHRFGSITSAALNEAEDLVADVEGAVEDHDEDEVIAAKFHDLSTADSEDNLAQIRKSIADLEKELEATVIVSEMEGRVVWTIDTISAVGNKISENESIVQIADTRDPFVEAAIDEQYVSDVSVGQEVAVTASGRLFPGAVERIGLLASIPPDGGPPEVDLDLSLEVEDFEALPGGTAIIELIVGVVPSTLVLPRGPFLSTGNHLYLYKIDGTAAIRTRVTYGVVTEKYAQIISGVSAGDEVITSSYQNYIDFESIELLGGNDD